MAVCIRLQRTGKAKKPSYRIVVIDSRKKRNGETIEILGTYNPLDKNERTRIREDRLKYWLNVGAQPTNTVKSLIKKLRKEG